MIPLALDDELLAALDAEVARQKAERPSLKARREEYKAHREKEAHLRQLLALAVVARDRHRAAAADRELRQHLRVAPHYPQISRTSVIRAALQCYLTPR